jgi:hypothetical protein
VAGLEVPLRAAYVATAEAVIDGYRTSSDPSPQKFDWPKAQVALEHAVAMDVTDQAARGS